jgi:predicted oxidoreductase
MILHWISGSSFQYFNGLLESDPIWTSCGIESLVDFSSANFDAQGL